MLASLPELVTATHRGHASIESKGNETRMLHVVKKLPPRVQAALFALSLAGLLGGVFLLIN